MYCISAFKPQEICQTSVYSILIQDAKSFILLIISTVVFLWKIKLTRKRSSSRFRDGEKLTDHKYLFLLLLSFFCNWFNANQSLPEKKRKRGRRWLVGRTTNLVPKEKKSAKKIPKRHKIKSNLQTRIPFLCLVICTVILQ